MVRRENKTARIFCRNVCLLCASLLSAKLKIRDIHLSRLGTKNSLRENFHFYSNLIMRKDSNIITLDVALNIPYSLELQSKPILSFSFNVNTSLTYQDDKVFPVLTSLRHRLSLK